MVDCRNPYIIRGKITVRVFNVKWCRRRNISSGYIYYGHTCPIPPPPYIYPVVRGRVQVEVRARVRLKVMIGVRVGVRVRVRARASLPISARD